jgi:glycosidase
MVDRFYNGTEDNDMPTDDPDILPIANFMGGDLQGVLKKLRSGYFDSLHMNTIWLSPIPKNPQGAYGLWDKGGVKSEFSSYHGYWPISFTEIDARFGNEEALKELVKIAHQKEKNILLDYVANHVHEEHPVYQAHKDEGWATDLYLEDSTLNTEKWDEHRLTTWFDTFLPTLNLEKQEITEMLSDSIIYWLEEYKVDGFRHDATKHIPLNFWRTLTAKIREYESDNGKEIFQIGETYGTAALISSYLSYGMLDAQFDFNMYDALVNALTNADGSFIKVAEQIKESSQYYGHHHLMGNMSGNQDKTRFMSLASGEVSLEEDTKLAGWTREINKQTDIGFSRLAMLHAFNFSIPGIPVVYYGDEIGMPGGNDPDNRRMMRFQSLSKKELELRDQLSQLTELRKQSLPLQWGNTRILAVDKNVLAILRTYGNEATVIVFNKGANRKILKLDLPFNTGDRCKVKFESDCKIVKDGLQIELNPYSFDFISFKNMKYE